MVHKYGGYILVDDAQYIAHNKENVLDNGIDFLAFSGHKLWWPTWIGVLYIKKWTESLLKYSSKVWWWTIKSITDTEVLYKSLPYFLEWWVQDFAWILWLASCIKFIENISKEEIHTYMNLLVQYFRVLFFNNNLSDFFDVVSWEGSLVITLIPKKFNVIDFHQYCNYFVEDFIVSFRTWTMCADNFLNHYLSKNTNVMRLSFWIYNTKQDIEIFFIILLEYIHKTQ